MSIEISADMSAFFRERLVSALARQGLQVTEPAEFYLVNLLTGYAHMPADRALSRPFVERLAEALEAPSREERLKRYRELGDCALYVCGFFSDHIGRRGVSRQYVVTMGGRAYVAAGDLAQAHRRSGELADVYGELAQAFDALARALDEVRESTSLRTPQDIIRLYERWQRTGSPLLAERLEQQGVFPQHQAARSRMVH